MQNAPATFQEFLNFKHLKDWPEIPSVEEPLHKEMIPVSIFSLDVIHEHFLVNAPLSVSAFGDMESKIDKSLVLLDSYASQMLCLPALDGDKDSLPRVFLTEPETPELSQDAHKNVKAINGINHEEKDNCVENCVFPGFERADLPGNIKAPQILQNIAKVQKLKEGTGKISTLLLSEKSIAIFQDCFWWFFLQKFKPQQVEQDYLFDRISDTFVALFCSIPQDVKEIFFQVYPNYLSQAIFTAFYKAFPQSRVRFNGKMKTEIVDLVFQWVSGIKPVPCFWEKWDVSVLECQKNDQNSTEKINTPQNLADVRRRLEFNLDYLLEETRHPHLSRTLDTNKNAITKESHSIGPGPEFQHGLFQLASHSLLVSNYLKRHHFTSCINRSQQRIKHPEISHLPPVGTTYQDIIKETQKLRKSLQQEYEMLETKTQKELAEIQQQTVIVKDKIEKMKQEVSSSVKLNSTLLLEKLQKMPFSSKLFRKKDLTIQDVLDADNECEPTTEQTLKHY
ncbi:protein FAM227B [Bufo bufo]|uniref:protein FAM227B n=1 Tax=Bufo bufo TaxID=8384 RepID=UPI001ABDDEBD|nr:protein FAM227B [Bufo bufo]